MYVYIYIYIYIYNVIIYYCYYVFNTIMCYLFKSNWDAVANPRRSRPARSESQEAAPSPH